MSGRWPTLQLPGRTLRGRLIASYVVVVLVTLVVVVGALSVLLRAYRDRQAEERLTELARPMVRAVAELNNRWAPLTELRVALAEQADANGLRLLVINPLGIVVADSEEQGSLEGRPFIQPGMGVPSGPGRAAPLQRSGRYIAPDGTVYRYVSIRNPVERRGVNDWATLVLAQPDYGWLGLWGGLVSQLALASLVALAVAVAIATLVARSLYRPIARLTQAAEAMARGQYDQQVPVEGPVELAGLAGAFNRMAGEVHDTRQATQEFVANVSHELRTPLTSIRGFVEALRDGTVTDEHGRERSLTIIQGELRRLQRLVNSLLDLSRLEAGQAEVQQRPVELAQVLTQCAEIVALRAEEAGIALSVDLPGQQPIVTGDADRLEQVVANLLDNALRYTAAGGQVRLALTVQPGTAIITVSDTGAGIAAAALPHLFERFYTADPARAGGGSGLGLAIAREIILAHGGDISVSSTVGLGSTFVVTLPLVSLVPATSPLASIR